MTTTVTGKYQGKPVTISITDGHVTAGARELAALRALGVARAGINLSVPGVWAGPASLTDPWGVRAVFLDILDRGTANFTGDPPPALAGGPPGTIY